MCVHVLTHGVCAWAASRGAAVPRRQVPGRRPLRKGLRQRTSAARDEKLRAAAAAAAAAVAAEAGPAAFATDVCSPAPSPAMRLAASAKGCRQGCQQGWRHCPSTTLSCCARVRGAGCHHRSRPCQVSACRRTPAPGRADPEWPVRWSKGTTSCRPARGPGARSAAPLGPVAVAAPVVTLAAAAPPSS